MRRDELPIPEPCHADWNAMEPRERARFCRACGIEVLDVSARTEVEARALAASVQTDRVCVSYIVRTDGSIRLADTPDVPSRSLVRRGRTLMAAASFALAACSPVADGFRAMGLDPLADAIDARALGQGEYRTAGAPVPMPPPPPPPDAGVPTPPPPCDPGPNPEHRVRGEMRVQGGVSPIDRTPPPPPRR